VKQDTITGWMPILSPNQHSNKAQSTQVRKHYIIFTLYAN